MPEREHPDDPLKRAHPEIATPQGGEHHADDHDDDHRQHALRLPIDEARAGEPVLLAEQQLRPDRRQDEHVQAVDGERHRAHVSERLREATEPGAHPLAREVAEQLDTRVGEQRQSEVASLVPVGA